MENKKLTSASGAPVADNHNVATAGRRGPMLLQDVWFLEKLAHFDREVIPERRMHAPAPSENLRSLMTLQPTPRQLFSHRLEKKQNCLSVSLP